VAGWKTYKIQVEDTWNWGTNVLSTALFSTWTILASNVSHSLYQHQSGTLFQEDKMAGSQKKTYGQAGRFNALGNVREKVLIKGQEMPQKVVEEAFQ
jgi:hypothetical protein